LKLPHPLHLHCNNLGAPGNYTTTLETMKTLESNRAHLAHLQYHAYGGDDWFTIRSEAPKIAEYFNTHPNLTTDAGAVLFGTTVTVTADGPWQHLLFQLTGRKWAKELGYPEPELSRVPDGSAESFAGVANHWTLGRVEPGSVVLDLGCGAGTDLLIAAQMTGPAGRVIGVDMTPAMLDRARDSAREMGFENVELHESLIESLPLEDASVDVVISNGVIDLVPDKDAVFDEIDRVLRPGGRLQVADVVIHTEVSEDARKRIDLWTG